MPSAKRRRRVAMVLPAGMVSRAVLHTPILEHLAASDELEVCFLTVDPADRETIERQGVAHLSWRQARDQDAPPRELSHGAALKGLARELVRRPLGKAVGFPQLVYRFNRLRGFRAQRWKAGLSASRHAEEQEVGNHAQGHLGWPLPDSELLFRLLYRVHHSSWQYGSHHAEAVFDELRPELLVLYHLQNQIAEPWALAARRRGIPQLGVVHSWDNLTTKGPLIPGVERHLVLNEAMRRELIGFHRVDPAAVEVIGWPQMDPYAAGELPDRAALDLPTEGRVILFAGNPHRLGRHEPSVAQHLAEQVAAGRYGAATLWIRPHPVDTDWEQRFGALHDPPRVVVDSPQSGQLGRLAGLLAHADVLVTSPGSISLDAVALGTAVINLAYDGDLQPGYFESVRRYYDMDHYRPVVETGGVRRVYGHEDLDRELNAYLADPERDAEGRRRLREELLEPFDGQASLRFVRAVSRAAREA